jgi:hypothetical protein
MSFTIEVVETHPPQNGKKLAKVKTKSGEEFGIWPDKLGTVRVGQRYEVEVEENEFNGRTYRKITKATPASAPAAANGKSAPASVTGGEALFVATVLAALIRAGEVKNDEAQLVATTKMLRGLWR